VFIFVKHSPSSIIWVCKFAPIVYEADSEQTTLDRTAEDWRIMYFGI
jgi:hypothetical protein